MSKQRLVTVDGWAVHDSEELTDVLLLKRDILQCKEVVISSDDGTLVPMRFALKPDDEQVRKIGTKVYEIL